MTERNNFYKDGSSTVFVLAIMSFACLIISLICSVSLIQKESERVYFAADKNGSLVKLVQLSQPNQNDSVVANWLSNAIVDTFSFNFTNANYRLNESTMKWFTPAGKDKFLSELNSSGYKSVVVDEGLIISAVLSHTPVLVKSGRRAPSNVYSWLFQTEAIITFRTKTREYSKKVLFTVTVDRVSIMSNVDGLGISSIVMQNAR